MRKIARKQPLVTVLMTAYNAERFVGQALESIANQTYKNLEILVVDDASTDGTYRLIKNWARQDKRIRVWRMNRNGGPSLASNLGIKKAKGEYLARMDADDMAFPGRIEKQVKFLQENPDVVMVGGQCVLIDERGEVIGVKQFPSEHKRIYESLFKMNPIQHPTCMINKKLVPDGKLRYHNHSVLAHDLELVFELAQYGKLANLKDVLLYYRQYPNSLSLKHPKVTFEATKRVREIAVKKYGYVPNVSGRMTNWAQGVVIRLLPERTIYPLFKMVRFSESKKM